MVKIFIGRAALFQPCAHQLQDQSARLWDQIRSAMFSAAEKSCVMMVSRSLELNSGYKFSLLVQLIL